MENGRQEREQSATAEVEAPPVAFRSAALASPMNVHWLRPGQSLVDDCGRSTIELLIVAEHPLFYAASRPCSVERIASLGDCDAHDGSARERVLMVIDAAFFTHSAHVTASAVLPELPQRYAGSDPFLREVGSVLLGEFHAERVPCATYLHALATFVAVHVASHHAAGRARVERRMLLFGRKLDRVTFYIDQHLEERIDIPRLAQLVHTSPYHFARMFKQVTSLPPHRYITLKRIERAKTLLRTTDRPIVDVAARVGFQTQGHFTAVFHRHTGLTPRAFRMAGCRAPRCVSIPQAAVQSWSGRLSPLLRGAGAARADMPATARTAEASSASAGGWCWPVSGGR